MVNCFKEICFFIFLCFGIGVHCNRLTFPGSDLSRGDRCDTGGGVLGICEEASRCLSTGGIVEPSDGSPKGCRVQNGKPIICCRRPYQIAHTLCQAWRLYWTSNGEQCISENNLIVGGEEADVGQFPHIALVGLEVNRRAVWNCGGSLVSPHFVLTAAHCIEDSTAKYVVKLGEHTLRDRSSRQPRIPRVTGPIPPGIFGENDLRFERRSRMKPEQLVRVAEFILHPNFEPDGLYNDIALLRLEKPVVLTKRVLPLCLPTDPKEDFLNFNLTAAGWGKLKAYKDKSSRSLQKVNIPAIPNVSCLENLLAVNKLLVPKGLTSHQLCAGEPGKDTCQGDSGGPLVLQLNKKTPCEHTQAGIVSFGNGCGNFGIYTRVSSYVGWITSYIAPGIVTPPY